ncbi:MAG: hypothetical protein ACR5KV_08495 [Wolbachia sp.]
MKDDSFNEQRCDPRISSCSNVSHISDESRIMKTGDVNQGNHNPVQMAVDQATTTDELKTVKFLKNIKQGRKRKSWFFFQTVI